MPDAMQQFIKGLGSKQATVTIKRRSAIRVALLILYETIRSYLTGSPSVSFEFSEDIADV